MIQYVSSLVQLMPGILFFPSFFYFHFFLEDKFVFVCYLY